MFVVEWSENMYLHGCEWLIIFPGEMDRATAALRDALIRSRAFGHDVIRFRCRSSSGIDSVSHYLPLVLHIICGH